MTAISKAYRFGCLLAILEHERAVTGNPYHAYQRLIKQPSEFVPMIARLKSLKKGDAIAEVMAGMPIDAFQSEPLIGEEVKIFEIGYHQQLALLKQY